MNYYSAFPQVQPRPSLSKKILGILLWVLLAASIIYTAGAIKVWLNFRTEARVDNQVRLTSSSIALPAGTVINLN
jgi:hypothetical protein